MPNVDGLPHEADADTDDPAQLLVLFLMEWFNVRSSCTSWGCVCRRR